MEKEESAVINLGRAVLGGQGGKQSVSWKVPALPALLKGEEKGHCECAHTHICTHTHTHTHTKKQIEETNRQKAFKLNLTI